MTSNQNQSVYESLCEVTPGGVNSPARAWRGISESPLIADHASGAQLWDADGKAYIDYCQSWGALIHGHADAHISQAAKDAIDKGSSFGMSTALEERLARIVVEAVPSVDQLRFVSSGTEATMSAARLARGYTGKPIIVKFTGHYHGHADFFLVQAGSGVAGLTPTSSSDGIPEEIVRNTVCLPFNDIEAVREYFAGKPEVAAVIVEPVACNMGVVPATRDFMRALREETERSGALLIFDEVITGFRCSPMGAQGIYEETPDLTCYGKIIGGGFPAAAFGGRREVMDSLAPNGTVYQAGTLSGNPVAMAAGASALSRLQDPAVYKDLEAKTNKITDPLREALAGSDQAICLQQVGSLFTLFFGRRSVGNFAEAQQCDLERFREYFHYMLDQGILVSPSQFEACFVSLAHTDAHLEKTRDAILAFVQGAIASPA